MNKSRILSIFAGVTLVIALAGLYLLTTQKQVSAPTKQETAQQETTASATVPGFSGSDEVLKNALNLYIEKKQQGQDMSPGPCLGPIGEDWVLDIAHNPRIAADDKAQNQCADFLEGRAHHFIELDPDGKLLNSE